MYTTSLQTDIFCSRLPPPKTHPSNTKRTHALTVSKFAEDVIAPRVREMDTASTMDPAVMSGLFEHGLMGVEAPEEYGGELDRVLGGSATTEYAS